LGKDVLILGKDEIVFAGDSTGGSLPCFGIFVLAYLFLIRGLLIYFGKWLCPVYISASDRCLPEYGIIKV